jgi:hypothetical protein
MDANDGMTRRRSVLIISLNGWECWALGPRGDTGVIVTCPQAAGGLGIIIVDDGICTSFDQYCCPGASKLQGEGTPGAIIIVIKSRELRSPAKDWRALTRTVCI